MKHRRMRNQTGVSIAWNFAATIGEKEYNCETNFLMVLMWYISHAGRKFFSRRQRNVISRNSVDICPTLYLWLLDNYQIISGYVLAKTCKNKGSVMNVLLVPETYVNIVPV
jgi:hypothetical protein